MCAKDDLLQRIKCTLGDVDSLFADNILSLIAFIISYRLFADKLVYALNRATVVLIIISRSTPSTLLAKFIPTTKIRDPLLKTLENAAKSGILLACVDGRIRQCYLTICAILRCLDKGHDDFVHLVNCFRWKHYNFNIHVSLATDTLHLLLKGLVMKMLDFMQDILDDIYPSKQKAIIQQLVAVVSPLFVLKAPFALHFIRAVCDLVTLAQYKSYDEDTLAYIQGALERMNIFKKEFRVALDGICTRANSEAYYITIVKQFYSITNKKEYILQICLHNSWRTALLAADYATVVKQRIQPYLTKLPLSEVAANIAISDFTHAAADRLDVDLSWVSRMSVQIHSSIKCWQFSSKRHNDSKHCNKEVVQEFKHRDNRRQSRTVTDGRVVAQLYLILTIIDYTCYDKDGKHIAYIRAFSEVLLFNNNRQIDNTTRMLSVPFKFYDLSTIIRLVHLVPRDLPNSTTYTTMSYYVNNYID
ncbi:hypothetical protein HBH75_160730 [Parastagonospora nodorum]|nr:hypothetical protein HBH75_160730 [Parastagonospora nodorum]